MSGESTRTNEAAHDQPIPANAATDREDKATDDRTGTYGGDDGALEHERTEVGASETLTPDDASIKSATDPKSSR